MKQIQNVWKATQNWETRPKISRKHVNNRKNGQRHEKTLAWFYNRKNGQRHEKTLACMNHSAQELSTNIEFTTYISYMDVFCRLIS